MNKLLIEQLENQLRQILGDALPEKAAEEINAAMKLARILENKGYSFQLKDLCPSSLTDTAWGAVFIKDGVQFSANNPQSAVAICEAALGALTTDA